MDDDINRIHKEGGAEKEEEGSKRDDDGDDDNVGWDRRGRGPHTWRTPQLTTRSTVLYPPEVLLLTPKPPRTKNDEEGSMVGILQFWVCAMGHMEAVAGLIMERDIDCLEHLTDVTC